MLLYCVLVSFISVAGIPLQLKGQSKAAMPENALMKHEDRNDFAQVQDWDELPDLLPPCVMSSTKHIPSDEVTPKTEGLLIY